MRNYLQSVVLGEERGPMAWVLRAALWPLSMLYCAGLAVYLAIYRCGLRRRHRLPVPVISIGNLTFGGTGKTPAVAAACQILQRRGLRVAVLSRGHGGTARGPLVVSDGHSVVASAAEAGDEPAMLARQLPGVYVLVGRDRRRTGALAMQMFSPDVIVLDDGLQYWQLHRDLDIVVMDASRPFGSGLVMPAGDLREPVRGLRRASVILLNDSRRTGAARYNDEADSLAQVAPAAVIFRCAHAPRYFVQAEGVGQQLLSWAKGRAVTAFCGIGRPDSFFAMLESLGADVRERMAFDDHHVYNAADLELVRAAKLRSGSGAVVTTEKDLARLGDSAVDDLFVLRIELEIEDNDSFERCLTERAYPQKATADAGQKTA